MNHNLFDILEICLQEIENGKGLEETLVQFPDVADELRIMLKAGQRLRASSAAMPSQQAMMQGRTKVLQRAAHLREQKLVSRRPMLSLFQRFSLTFSVLTVLLASGTGLVSASSGALPGQNLYSVKRTWEDVRLLFVTDQFARIVLENEYEQERLHEANELLAEGLFAEVRLEGVVLEQNGKFFISGLPVLVTAETKGSLSNGIMVIATGSTNEDGLVVLSSIELLPPGSIVPLGKALKAESDEHDGFHIEGHILLMQGNTITINHQLVYLENTTINGNLTIGLEVEVEGYFSSDGRFVATKIELEDSDEGTTGGNNGNDDIEDDSIDHSGSSTDDNSGSGSSNSGVEEPDAPDEPDEPDN